MAKTAKKQGKGAGTARKAPMRMCVACREMRPKASLLRVVKPPDKAISENADSDEVSDKTSNEISLDKTGKMPGRGAYVCKKGECVDKAQKHKALERALETRIDAVVFDKIRAIISGEVASDNG